MKVFILLSFDKTNIERHFSKSLNNYDPNGLNEKFIGVYCESNNFELLATKYFEYINILIIQNINIITTEDITDTYAIGTELKVYKTTYQRENGKKLIAYHILVNLKL